MPPGSAAAHHERVQFATTHWSLVVCAGQNNGETARRAWELLAQRYWYPLYAFVRRSGASPEDAPVGNDFSPASRANPLPADAPQGHCPACLATAVLEAADAPEVPPEPDPADRKPALPLTQITIEGFELFEELGRGAMGIVYRARELEAQRFVALKVLDAGFAPPDDAIERFAREATVVAGLDHPGIVRLYATGRAGRHGYFAMELVEGRTLEDAAHAGPLPATVAARHLAQVARAIAQAPRQAQPATAALVSPRGNRVLVQPTQFTADLWPIEGLSALRVGLIVVQGETNAAFSPDGTRLATADPYGIALLFHCETAAPLGPELSHPQPAREVCFTPDGNTLITAATDRAVRVWNPFTGELRLPVLQTGEGATLVGRSLPGEGRSASEGASAGICVPP